MILNVLVLQCNMQHFFQRVHKKTAPELLLYVFYVCVEVFCSYVSGSSEDLGQDHSGQTVSAVVQSGYSKFQHSVLVLYRTQVQQAANTRSKADVAFTGFI